MSGLLLAGLVGALSGAVAGVLAGLLYVRRTGVSTGIHGHVARGAPDPTADPLAAEFAQHARAVREQVSRYADLLADGDAVLRARLRRIEDGAS